MPSDPTTAIAMPRATWVPISIGMLVLTDTHTK